MRQRKVERGTVVRAKSIEVFVYDLSLPMNGGAGGVATEVRNGRRCT